MSGMAQRGEAGGRSAKGAPAEPARDARLGGDAELGGGAVPAQDVVLGRGAVPAGSAVLGEGAVPAPGAVSGGGAVRGVVLGESAVPDQGAVPGEGVVPGGGAVPDGGAVPGLGVVLGEGAGRRHSRRAVLGGSVAGLAALAATAGAATAGATTAAATTAAAEPVRGGRGRFAGKVVIITGGTSGIGKETAVLFAAEGAKVGFCGRREELGRQVERDIRRAGGDVTYVRADVRDPAQVESFVDGVVRRYGRLDVAFNNAGIHLGKPLHEITVAEWDDVHLTNARGVFLAIKHEVPHLTNGGVIICTASSQAGHTRPGHAAYTASKRAVEGVVRAAALDYGTRGIRVLAIDPGTTDTRLVRPPGIPDDVWAQFKQAWGPLNVYGLPRMAEPAEIASAVVALAHPDFGYLTGTEILVDGGMSTGRPMTFPPGFEQPA